MGLMMISLMRCLFSMGVVRLLSIVVQKKPDKPKAPKKPTKPAVSKEPKVKKETKNKSAKSKEHANENSEKVTENAATAAQGCAAPFP